MTTAGRAAAWILALILVPAGMATAIKVSLPEQQAQELRDLHPLDIGTTWTYAVTSKGKPSGTRTRQVVSQAGIGDELLETVAVKSHYTDYLGQGPRTNLIYMGLSDDALLQHGFYANNEYTEIEPPAPAYELPIAAGAEWTYKGKLGNNDLRSEVELVGIEDIESGGRKFTGCAHYVNKSRFSGEGFSSSETVEEWTCPNFGPVRVKTVNPDEDVEAVEELVAFHGSRGNWTAQGFDPAGDADPIPADAPGTTTGLDGARTNRVPDATVDLGSLAWTDSRSEVLDFPPVGANGVMVAGEVEGSVSALDTNSGQILWRVRLEGPVIASPVIAGDVVLVADSAKNLWALDMQTGAARWAQNASDQVSAAPVVVRDKVIVVRDDRSITALRLRDGTRVWGQKSTSLIRSPPAATDEQVVVANEDGEVVAFDPDNGTRRWTANARGIPASGPAIGEGVVVVSIQGGTVYGFAEDSGDLAWEENLNVNVFIDVAIADGKVVLIAGTTRLIALDADAGDRLWESPLGSAHYTAPVVAGNEVVTVGHQDAKVRTWNLANGAPVAQGQLPRPTAEALVSTDIPAAVVGDSLVFTSEVTAEGHETTMTAFPLRNAESAAGGPRGVAFKTEVRAVPSAPYAPGALLGDTLFVAGQDEVLYRSTGETDVEPVHTTQGSQPFTVAAGDVVLVQKDQELLALPPDGGEPAWSFPVGEPFAGSVPAVADGTVFVPEYQLGLAAVDLATGGPKWFQPIANAVGTTQPVPLPGGDVFYGSGTLARYDGRTGSPEWSIADAQLFSSAATDGGIVFAAAIRDQEDSGLMAIDAASGEVLWQEVNASNTIVAGPAAADGIVVNPDALGRVSAYEGRSGEEIWSMQLETPVGGTPYIHDGLVYISEIGREEDVYQREFRVVAKDLATGKFVGAFQPPGQGYQLFPAVGPAQEGTLGVPATNRLGGIVMFLRRSDD